METTDKITPELVTPQPSPQRLTLRKEEKLRHKTLVDKLFAEGKNIYDYPLRLVWLPISKEDFAATFRAGEPDNMGSLQMLITIPKKKRRRAVDRVLLRRRVREAYRLNRSHLADVIRYRDDIKVLCLAFIFIGEENTSYNDLDKKMKNILSRLEKKIDKLGKEEEDKEKKETKE